MPDPGATRDDSMTERRSAEFDDLTPREERDESELYDDEDNIEPSPGTRGARVDETASMSRDNRDAARSVSDAARADWRRGNAADEARANANRSERIDTQNAVDQNATDRAGSGRLFSEFDVNAFRTRWNDVQTGFVDSPRHAVEQADKLVANVMERIANEFAQERSLLEKQWGRGDNVSTEDLRVALQRYREFFGRLLTAA